MILAADKITEIQQLTPPHFIIQHQKPDVARQTHRMEELWQKWGQPEIWRLPQGHVSLALGVPGLTGRVLHWLSPRLNGDTVRTLNK
jgi:hypothetical protein